MGKVTNEDGPCYGSHYGRTEGKRYPSTVGDTDICERCGWSLLAEEAFSGEATIQGFSGIRYHSELNYRDPLQMLAAGIGASMPFTVTNVESPTDYGYPVLVGLFRGGTPIRVTLAASRTVNWVAYGDAPAVTPEESEVAQ